MLSFLIDLFLSLITRPTALADVNTADALDAERRATLDAERRAMPDVAERYDHDLPLMVGWHDGVATVAGHPVILPQTQKHVVIDANGDLWVDGENYGQACLFEVNYVYLISAGALR